MKSDGVRCIRSDNMLHIGSVIHGTNGIREILWLRKYDEDQEQSNCVGGNRFSKLDKYGLICLIANYTGIGNRQEVTVCVKVSRKHNI